MRAACERSSSVSGGASGDEFPSSFAARLLSPPPPPPAPPATPRLRIHFGFFFRERFWAEVSSTTTRPRSCSFLFASMRSAMSVCMFMSA